MVLSSSDPSDHSKSCTLCHTPGHDVLIRCQVDDTGKWHLICPAPCWKRVSGGVVDGARVLDEAESQGENKVKGEKVNPWYRYGGMWKNKVAGVSAKMPKKGKGKGKKSKRVQGDEETSGGPEEVGEGVSDTGRDSHGSGSPNSEKDDGEGRIEAESRPRSEQAQ